MSVEHEGGENCISSDDVKREMFELFQNERGGSAAYQAFIDYRALEKHSDNREKLIKEFSSEKDSTKRISARSHLRVAESVLARIEYDIEKKKSLVPGYYEANTRIKNIDEKLLDTLFNEQQNRDKNDEYWVDYDVYQKRKSILDELTVELIMRH